ncbi:hypothetical protein C900_01450 [Fulvivirga imtechensis AK7]|uniref:Uncharacterized protein n=1 Tax=Fulvivirga imtechensis AK7 TaxID=1237149 RepID=L8JWC7_9BACT|nr:hypothetical protein C900_01450 [Fulvivirga imtechensis AK7]
MNYFNLFRPLHFNIYADKTLKNPLFIVVLGGLRMPWYAEF